MKIIACIKQVPDSEAKVKAEGGQVSWGDAPLVINPFDEYAVEGALQQRGCSHRLAPSRAHSSRRKEPSRRRRPS